MVHLLPLTVAVAFAMLQSHQSIIYQSIQKLLNVNYTYLEKNGVAYLTSSEEFADSFKKCVQGYALDNS